MCHLLAVLGALAGLPAVGKTIAGTASVIDGDTLEIHGLRIRLSAIDTIESRQSCLLPDGRHWSCGRDAAIALSDKIGCVPHTCVVKDKDRYGRAVAACRSGSTDVGAWMVENGRAVAYRRYGLD